MVSPDSAAERIRTLRELNGWTQSDLAAAAGISQPLLSSIEKLRRDASEETIAAICDATGTPASFFAVEPSTIPADSLHFRKNKTAPVKLTTQVRAFYREAHRVSIALLERVDFPVTQLPAADARSGELDEDAIEDYALKTRAALRLEALSPIPNVIRAVERAGWGVFRFALPGVEEGRVVGKGHFGLSYRGAADERAVIGYFSGSGDRDRFTIAHELGHCVMHSYRPSSDSAEAEAHGFAGAFLLPRERMQELVTPSTSLSEFARIKANFGVSIQAIIMRATRLGLIDEARRAALFVQVGQRGWRTAEPVDVPNEESQLLAKSLATGWAGRDVSGVADELGIHPQVLRSIAPRIESSRRPSAEASVTDLASRRRA